MAAYATRPSVNHGGAASALSDVSANSRPASANSRPNPLPGRRHQVYAPPVTTASTNPPRTAALSRGCSRTSLPPTTTTVRPAARTPAPAVIAGPETRPCVRNPGRAAPAPNSGDELIRNTAGEATLCAGGAGLHTGTPRCTHRGDVVDAQVRERARGSTIDDVPHQAISGVR